METTLPTLSSTPRRGLLGKCPYSGVGWLRFGQSQASHAHPGFFCAESVPVFGPEKNDHKDAYFPILGH